MIDRLEQSDWGLYNWEKMPIEPSFLESMNDIYGKELSVWVSSMDRIVDGVLLTYSMKRFGISVLISPPFLPRNYFFVEEVDMKPWLSFLEGLKGSFILTFPDNRVALRKERICTHTLPLVGYEHMLNENRRRDLKKVEAQGLEVGPGKVEDLRKFVLQTAEQNELVYNETILDLFLEHGEGCGLKIFAGMIEGKIVGSQYFMDIDDVRYYLGGGSTSEIKGIPTGILWHAIRDSAEQGMKIFDFEGSQVEGIARFFKSFGASEIPLYRISKISKSTDFALNLKALIDNFRWRI